MNRLCLSLPALLMLSGFAGQSGAAKAAAPAVSPGLAIVGADLLMPDAGAILKDYTVVVANGRIVTVGPEAKVAPPAGYSIVDAHGETLVPGLADMHVHLANVPGEPGDAAQRALAVMLSYGVTTVRSMAGGANHIALRDAVEKGAIPGPRIYAASMALNDQNTTSVAAGVAAVDNAKKAGFDLIKSHNLPDVATWQAIEDEAHKAGLPVAGHVTNEVGLDRALKEHEEVEHLDGAVAELLPPDKRIGYEQVPPPEILAELDKVGDSAIEALAAKVKAAGSVQDPTLAIFQRLLDVGASIETLKSQPTMRYVPAPVLAQWAAQHEQLAQAGFTTADARRLIAIRNRIVAAYFKAGVPIMTGSDTAQDFQIWGDGLIEEMRALSNAGLGAAGALRAATIVPRDYLRSLVNGGSSLGWKAEFGSIEPGARADLVLVKGDPLNELSVLKEPEWVIAGGRPYDRRMLLQLRDQAAADAQASTSASPPPSGAGPQKPRNESAAGSSAGACADAHLAPTARCGIIFVNEDRQSKGGRKIPIRYAVLPAAHQSGKAPLVVIPGGPGLGGVQSGQGIAQLFAGFNSDRDILLVDQRGTGASNRLACPAWDDHGNPFAGLDGPPVAAISACRAKLEQSADLTKYGTREAVYDLDEVRSALGYSTLDLFGMSYGTRVALDYARIFPSRTDRIVIRSAAPAAMRLPLWTPRDVQHSYDVLAKTCAEQPACAAKHDLSADLQAIQSTLARGPVQLRLRDPRSGKDLDAKLDRDAFGELMFFMLYVPQLYTQLPPLLTQAASGDFKPLVNAAAPMIFGIDDSVAWGMYYSVVCKEDVDHIASAEIAPATAGTFMGAGPVQRQKAICAQWKPAKASVSYLKPVRTNKPVLIMSGNMDPVAGKPWADEIQRTLPNSVSVLFAGASHLPPLPGCAQELMLKFLDGAAPKSLDVSCAADSAMPALKP